VRDYIHVSDLIGAHLLALDHLKSGGNSLVMNVGYGRGFSVRDVVRTAEQVSGRAIAVWESPRRAGDPPALVADSSRLKQTLNWQPRHDDLNVIVKSAFDWEQRLHNRAKV
jgi:UDP-glucose 4-epimerase